MVLTFIQIFLTFTHIYIDVFANTSRFTYVPYISYATCAHIVASVCSGDIYVPYTHVFT